MTENILDDYFSNDIHSGSDINRDIGLFTLNTILPEKSLRLAYLYYSAFASEYSVFGPGKELSSICVIGALLLIYRFITVDQFHALLPQFRKYRLSNYNNWSNQKDKSIIAATDLDKKRVYFHLTKTGYNYFRSFFPEEFLSAARIPANPGKLPSGSRVLHDIMLRDVPYGCLAINNFSEFDWFTSIKLLDGKTPVESVTASMANDKHSKTKTPDTSKIIADGIMIWRNEDNCSVIIEQDKGTESDSIIADKLCSYGDYLNTIEHIENIYIVFNIYLSRNSNAKNTNNSLSSTFNNITLLMAHSKISSLEDFYDEISDKVQSSSNKRTSFSFMLKLLDSFAEDGHSLSEGIASLRTYVNKKKEDMALIHKDTSPQSKAHYTNLKNLATSIINGRSVQKNGKHKDSNDYSRLIRAIDKGTSILFTENCLNYAYYLFPYDSGFVSSIKNTIETAYNEHNICKMQRTFKTNRGIVLKNCIIVNSEVTGRTSFFCIHEISCDIASYYRLGKLFKSYAGNSVELHFLILVSSVKDATKFCAVTNCIDKYCCSDNILIPNPEHNLTIRFMDYGSYSSQAAPHKLFVPYKNSIIEANIL